MSYPLLSTIADRWDPPNSGPHASVTQNRVAALHDIARPWLVDGELHRRWHHYYCDPRDLAHRLSYLVGLLAGANDDGGGHGGSEELDGGATPVEATAVPTKAWMSIYKLR